MLNRKIGMTIVAGSVLVLTQAALAASPASEVLSDASSRISLAGETSGYDGGHFFLGDGTKANRLAIYGYSQFRYQDSFVNNVSPAQDVTHGFQIRRVRLGMSGSVGDPNMSFNVNGDFSDSNGGLVELKDAWAKYHFGNGVNFRAGQYKTGMTREQLIGDEKQLLVERSITDGVFSWGRSQGVGITGDCSEQIRYYLDFTDGPNSHTTEYDSIDEADFGLVARGEFLVLGKSFDGVSQYSSWTSTPENTGIVGASLGWAYGGGTGAGTGSTTKGNVIQLSVDTQWSGDGWNAFAAGHFRNTDPGAGGTKFTDFGLVAQGGYFFQENLEGFGRIDSTIPDTDSPNNAGTGTANAFTTIGAGVNYYIVPKSQASKVTAQLNYFVNSTEETALIATGTDNNLFATNEKGQIALIFQWQVVW
jgi:hypothetical protein